MYKLNKGAFQIGLYSNAKRMVTMFCGTIVCLTLIMLTLRLTVFSDMASSTPDGVESAGSAARDIEDGRIFPYKLNVKLVFPKADGTGDMLIQNPETNTHLLSINIILPDTKESLYYTGILEPGASIEKDMLSLTGQKLANGIYDCVAEISARDPDTLLTVESEKKPVTVYIGTNP